MADQARTAFLHFINGRFSQGWDIYVTYYKRKLHGREAANPERPLYIREKVFILIVILVSAISLGCMMALRFAFESLLSAFTVDGIFKEVWYAYDLCHRLVFR